MYSAYVSIFHNENAHALYFICTNTYLEVADLQSLYCIWLFDDLIILNLVRNFNIASDRLRSILLECSQHAVTFTYFESSSCCPVFSLCVCRSGDTKLFNLYRNCDRKRCCDFRELASILYKYGHIFLRYFCKFYCPINYFLFTRYRRTQYKVMRISITPIRLSKSKYLITFICYI